MLHSAHGPPHRTPAPDAEIEFSPLAVIKVRQLISEVGPEPGFTAAGEPLAHEERRAGGQV